MKVVLITGMLASGKSIALRVFQDMDYYVIDNMPPSLIPRFMELAASATPKIDKVAFVIDIRAEGLFKDIDEAIEYLREATIFDMLFIDASDEVLISRYKLNRRRHITFEQDRISEAIRKEREMLEPLREAANYIIDTSATTEAELKEKIHEIYDESGEGTTKFLINISSFGFKYGILSDADMVFDARFAPNPFYIPELKPLSGLDERVSGYVLRFPETRTFLDKIRELIDYLIPYYKKEGKTQLIIGIGCSGGRHRSGAIAEALKETLSDPSLSVIAEHRDLERDTADDRIKG